LKRKVILLIAFIISPVFTNNLINAHKDEKTSPFKVTADLVSIYVWRGSLATGSPTPNFLPTLAYLNGNFEIGVWGSTDFVGSYKELDPYFSLIAGKFKLTFTDYNWNFHQADYFNYKNSETGHRFEGTVGFTGSESFPVSILWNSMFYGLNKNPENTTKQAFSTYVELGYTRGPATVFPGLTPWTGYYNNYGVTIFDPGAEKKSFSIVSIGASVSKALKISESYFLPLGAILVVNPSATYSRNDFVHLVFVITF
jgi:hypothetical protein